MAKRELASLTANEKLLLAGAAAAGVPLDRTVLYLLLKPGTATEHGAPHATAAATLVVITVGLVEQRHSFAGDAERVFRALAHVAALEGGWVETGGGILLRLDAVIMLPLEPVEGGDGLWTCSMCFDSRAKGKRLFALQYLTVDGEAARSWFAKETAFAAFIEAGWARTA